MLLRQWSRFLFANEVIKSVPGHKPPSIADNAPGRYAGSLFTVASKNQALHTVLQDLKHLNGVISSDSAIRQFLKNSAIKRNQQRQVFNSFSKDNYHNLTVNFIDTLIDSGRYLKVQNRLSDLPKIIEKYVAYCKILNKEEDIRVISAKPLTNQEQEKVIAAIKKNKPQTKFRISYQVDTAILGGLQIFAGTQFLDCSLRSRMQRLKTELNKIG